MLPQEKLKIGQVVRFKNYKRNEEEKEAYFVVIQEEDATNEMVLFTLNSNRYYKSGTTMTPEFPEEDLRIVDLRPSDLIDQEITIKETIFNDLVTDKAAFFNSDNYSVHFTKMDNTLVSDALFEVEINSKIRLMGPLLIDMDYKNNSE